MNLVILALLLPAVLCTAQTNLPPLPIPFTPEENAKLVRQGVRPPKVCTGTNASGKVPKIGNP